MGRFYEWSEDEKVGYRKDLQVALENNDLAALKN